MGRHFKKVILRTVQKHTEERNIKCKPFLVLSTTYNMTLQSMRLLDHVTLNFNDNLSMAAEFLVMKKAFDTAWHSGLLYKLSELQFLTSVIQPISSFLTNGK
jgi:hypothetical protein